MPCPFFMESDIMKIPDLYLWLFASVLVVLLCVRPVHATTFPPTSNTGTCTGIGNPSTASSPSDCISKWSALNVPPNWTGASINRTVGLVTYFNATSYYQGVTSTHVDFFTFTYASASCPVNSTGTSACTCNSGYIVNGANNGCVVASTCPAGGILGTGVYKFDYITNHPGDSVCSGGCSASGSGTVIGSGISNGVAVDYAQYTYTYNGSTCGSTTSLPPLISSSTLPADSCPVGQVLVHNVYGYVCNVVSGASSSVTATTTTNSTASGANTSTTTGTSTTVTNPDGSQTTTINTTTTTPNSIPSDLAKTGDIQAQTTTLGSKLDTINGNLDTSTVATAPATTLPSQSSTAATITSSIADVVNLVPANSNVEESWSWFQWVPDFGAATSCSVFTKAVPMPTATGGGTKTISIDLCTWVDYIRSGIGFMFALYTMWVLFGLTFKKGQ